MTKEMELLVFEVDGIRCALPLGPVVRVESAAEVTPIPNAPEKVAGVLNVRGEVLPVLDMRRCLSRPAQPMQLNDHLILAQTEKRKLVLWVGELEGVENLTPASGEHVEEVLKSLPHLSGVTALDDELIMIHDLEQFLSTEEDQILTRALEDATS